MLSSKFSNIRNTRFHQSSPVQPISEFRGVPRALQTDEGEVRKSLCLILENISKIFLTKKYAAAVLGWVILNITYLYSSVIFLVLTLPPLCAQNVIILQFHVAIYLGG